MCGEASQPRERLLEAGQALFSNQGYAATSMRQVAERAGLSLGNIYNHFPSKEAIFQALLLEYNPFTRCNLRPLPENFNRPQIKTLLAELDQQPEFFNLILIELLEFKGKHLPRLFENISGNSLPTEAWRTLISMVISFHTTQILLASALPPDVQSKISPETVLDFILNCHLAPE